MTFADPDTIRTRLRRATAGRHATIEFGHAEARSGIVVRFELVDSRGELEGLLYQVVEAAGRMPRNLQAVTDAGWWAAVACSAAHAAGWRASVLRGNDRSKLHACGIVARGGMLDEFPDWPLFRIGHSARLLDLRGEAATAVPSDADLLRYAEDAGVRADAKLLRQMFEVGVLGWGGIDERTGRRRIVGAVNA